MARPRMQDVDRVADVEVLAEPARHRCPRVECQARVSVVSAQHAHRIGRQRGSARHVRQEPTVRPPEPKPSVGESIDPITLLVHRAVVSATQEREIRELRGPALSPVMDVVSLPDTHAAAREATPVVAMVQRPPESRRDRAGPGADLRHAPVRVMAHDDPARIAGQALRRSSWNAETVFEHGLAWLGRVGQDGGVDVDDHLIVLARSAGIDAVMERSLGQ
jgi:hypothetical protein